VPLSLAAVEIADTDELPARARNTLLAFMRDVARWRDLAKQTTPAELARTMLDESGYTAALQAEKSAESAGRLENLAELARAMEEYETLGDFLEHVSLVMDNEANDRAEKLTIMTIHAAKGLEFDHVFLPGWEEGVFPSQRAMDEGGLASLEEERRLAYVAITRARRRCTILHAANRRIYGQWSSSIPSRFIGELPQAHVQQESTLSGGASLWRAQWSETSDPFAHVSRGTGRGPGWQRAATQSYDPTPRRLPEATRSAASFAAKPRTDVTPGCAGVPRKVRLRHGHFAGRQQAGDRVRTAGPKRVIDSFVKLAE
jgi:DNA helicase II / ATP-dependent DNA helicase PcrA